MVRRAPLATATSAIRLKIQSGRPKPVALMTAGSGPLELASFSVGRALDAAIPIRRYTTPAVSIAPNSARGYTRLTSRTSSATLAETSKPTKE